MIKLHVPLFLISRTNLFYINSSVRSLKLSLKIARLSLLSEKNSYASGTRLIDSLTYLLVSQDRFLAQ